jgi:MazG family protein
MAGPPRPDAQPPRAARPPESPDRSVDSIEALARLDALARRLRRECPWDREQDERSIVPHTVDEAYELADAAHSGDDAKLLDELGDVLFQVHFLALLLEERGAGDLAAVADGCREKLIRRHPHVFGTRRAEDAETVRRNWDEIKKTQEGRGERLFGDVPENLPGPLYARKAQRRAAAAGHDVPDTGAALDEVERALVALRDGAGGEEGFRLVGDLLFAAVAAARKLSVDPELALRAATQSFMTRVEEAGPR